MKLTCPNCGRDHRLSEPYPLPGTRIPCACGRRLGVVYPAGMVESLRDQGRRFLEADAQPTLGSPVTSSPPRSTVGVQAVNTSPWDVAEISHGGFWRAADSDDEATSIFKPGQLGDVRAAAPPPPAAPRASDMLKSFPDDGPTRVFHALDPPPDAKAPVRSLVSPRAVAPPTPARLPQQAAFTPQLRPGETLVPDHIDDDEPTALFHARDLLPQERVEIEEDTPQADVRAPQAARPGLTPISPPIGVPRPPVPPPAPLSPPAPPAPPEALVRHAEPTDDPLVSAVLAEDTGASSPPAAPSLAPAVMVSEGPPTPAPLDNARGASLEQIQKLRGTVVPVDPPPGLPTSAKVALVVAAASLVLGLIAVGVVLFVVFGS